MFKTFDFLDTARGSKSSVEKITGSCISILTKVNGFNPLGIFPIVITPWGLVEHRTNEKKKLNRKHQ